MRFAADDVGAELDLMSCLCGVQDKKVKGKIDARNSLETYVYNLKSSVEDKLKGKISEADAAKVKSAIAETVEWLDEHSDGEQVRTTPQPHWLGALTRHDFVPLEGGTHLFVT